LRKLLITALSFLLILPACGAQRRASPMRNADRPGSILFRDYCAACHLDNGQGTSDTPALAGSSWVTGPASRLIKIVLHGVRGPMQVSGATFDREMPGFAPVLSDAEVASLVSFVRGRFGASNGAVAPAEVSRIRAENSGRTEYWGVDELLKPD
jgi:mono/diheme cytochrome c family protein